MLSIYVYLLFTSPEMGLVPYFLIHGTMLLNARKIRDDLITLGLKRQVFSNCSHYDNKNKKGGVEVGLPKAPRISV